MLVLPLGVCVDGAGVHIDAQAANGLVQWLRHFKAITLCVKRLPAASGDGLVLLNKDDFEGRLDVVILPNGWTPLAHLKALPQVRSLLDGLIDRHEFLHFALMGGWGDWSALGLELASRKGLKSCVWTDRVESEVIALDASRHRGVKRLMRLLNARVARRNERRAIGKASLGLFHGRDTFDHFQGFSQNPHLVHNIHLKPADRIAPDQLAVKITECSRGPLKIIYAGRVHPDKGVSEWIETLRLAKAAGVEISAKWLGTGPQLNQAREAVDRLGLQSAVSFSGSVEDRQELLSELRNAHVMLFCHLTPESPRCLIEALAVGTPIVGFGTAYSEDLISGHGGGQLTAMDPSVLAERLIELDRDRKVLARLIEQAARDGYHMNDEAVFRHRAELIRAHC